MSEITEPLLQENEPPKPAALVLKDVLLQKDDEDYQGKEPSKGGGQEKGKGEESKQKKEPPYSVCNEIRFFFNRGIPLGLASLLEWGIPPWYSLHYAMLRCQYCTFIRIFRKVGMSHRQNNR